MEQKRKDHRCAGLEFMSHEHRQRTVVSGSMSVPFPGPMDT